VTEARAHDGRLLALILAGLACLPVLVARYPQMTDYPAHLARYHVMLNLGHSADLARFYTYHWSWTPNLGVDILIQPLAALFGVESAGRIVVALIPVLLGLAMMAVEWTLRRRIGPGTLFAFATIWSPSLLLGFLNFSLALALALFAFALWVRAGGRNWRTPLFLAIAPLVWLCHLSGWGVLGVLVFGYEWQRRPGLFGVPGAALATWPLWPPVALTVLLGGGASGALAYGPNLANWKLSNWAMGLRDQTIGLDLLTVAVLATAPFMALRFRHIDGRLGRAALILAALTLAVPRHLGGGDFADYRLVPVTLMVGCMAIDWRPSRWVLALCALPFLLRLSLTSVAWYRESRELEGMLAALDHLPRGARVASAVAEEPFAWRQPAFGHIGCYATLRRDALTNAHFAIPGLHSLQLRSETEDFTDPSQRVLVETGQHPDLADFAPARRADWLWYVGEREPTRLPPGAQIVFRTHHSLLARLANPPQGL
jgi:hypothetical protein